jgi:hypothetical protein
MRMLFLAFLGALLGAASPAAAAGPAVPLAGQRALYQLTLESTRGIDVVGVSGTMRYEQRDTCDGWATSQELRLTVTHADGEDAQMLSHYVTWEARNGLSMRFQLEQATDGTTTADIAGTARLQRAGGAGEVRYRRPEPRVLPLPAGTLFPTAHTARILAAARAGQRFFTVALFDGTSANGGQLTSVLILSRRPPAPSPWPALAALASARVQVAFFDPDPASMRPDFAIAMRYWDNGVADSLSLDFGDFVLHGTLVTLTLLPAHC